MKERNFIYIQINPLNLGGDAFPYNTRKSNIRLLINVFTTFISKIILIIMFHHLYRAICWLWLSLLCPYNTTFKNKLQYFMWLLFYYECVYKSLTRWLTYVIANWSSEEGLFSYCQKTNECFVKRVIMDKNHAFRLQLFQKFLQTTN